jgi:ferrochelatase
MTAAVPHDRVAVLLMAYGTPRHPDEVEAYYTDIRRGRPPTPEQLTDLVRRYYAIGGLSPLLARTEAQRTGLQSALDKRAPGSFVVTLMKHAAPSIGTPGGPDRRGPGGRPVLAPHHSAFSVGQYVERRRAAGDKLEVLPITDWHLEPAYLDFLAAAVRSGLAALPDRSKVLFTAHSLPQRIIAAGDPYADQMQETAAAVAERAGLAPWGTWSLAWQSAGRTPEPWIGPDILTVIDGLAAAEGTPGLLVCACGFVSDHLEVLYDLDIEARRARTEACLRPHAGAQRRPDGARRPRRPVVDGRAPDAGRRGRRWDHRVGGGVGAPASPQPPEVTLLEAADRLGGRSARAVRRIARRRRGCRRVLARSGATDLCAEGIDDLVRRRPDGRTCGGTTECTEFRTAWCSASRRDWADWPAQG